MVKIIVITLLVIVLVIPGYLWGLAYLSRSGQATGLVEGKLSACPKSPNCVSTEAGTDTQHHMQAFNIPKASVEQAGRNIMKHLVSVIQEMGGDIKTENQDYIAATFQSGFFGFVDDLECRIDMQAGQIQSRSASRVGTSDLGVNRKRVERLQHLLQTALQDNTDV